MKKIFVLFLCLIPFSVFAQTTSSDTNRTDVQGRKQGTWKKYEKGALVYEGQFKDNVPYGTFKYYHTNGKLKSTTEFIQGVHKVKTVIYHENGNKASEGVFIDQVKDGTWNYYSNKDQLIKVENYENGARTGSWKTYSVETGVLLEEKNYDNNKLNGVYKTYYTNGEVSLEENYIDGKLNGKAVSYYPKTHYVSYSGEYHNGLRIGTWNFLDVNGKKRSTVEYEEQKVANTYVYLYQGSNGQKINQDLIAYFMKNGEKSVAVLRSGKKINVDESLDDISLWADFLVFIRVSPSMIAAIDAIVGYKEVEDADNDAIIVKVRPAPDNEVYSEGTEAKMVKSLFNKEMPKE